MDLYFKEERLLGEKDITDMNGKLGQVVGFDGKGWIKPVDQLGGSGDIGAEVSQKLADLEKKYDELFTSVSDGKDLVASAITDKGVPTDKDATFQTMADNVRSIKTHEEPDIEIDWHHLKLPNKTSTDGSQNFTEPVYADGKFFIMSHDGYIWQSEDGINWTKMNGLYGKYSSSASDDVAFCYGKGIFVAYAGGSWWYSNDLVNWTKANVSDFIRCIEISYADGKFVAISNHYNYIRYSEDGINWTGIDLGQQFPTTKYMFSLSYGNGRFVAVGYSGGFYSDDCKTWKEFIFPITFNNATGMIYNSAYGGGKFVVFGRRTGDYQFVALSSKDGVEWEDVVLQDEHAGSFSTYPLALAYGSGIFCELNSIRLDPGAYHSPFMFYSKDGIDWYIKNISNEIESLLASTLNNFRAMTYGKGRFVAVTSYDPDVLCGIVKKGGV